jgi:hypothetical protein
MKKCYVCEGKGRFKHLDRDICKKCFLKNIEKRVKKHLGRKMFKKGDKILVIGGVEKVLLEKAIGGLPLKITFRKRLPKEIKVFDYVVTGKTMDEIDEKFLRGLMKGRLVLGKVKKKFFNITEVLTDEEIKRYAELNNVAFKVRKKKRILDGLKSFKEIKYNLYKNIKNLRNVFIF